MKSTNQLIDTPLHLAAKRGDIQKVEELLASGSSPSQLNENQQYPIQCALFTPVLIDADYKNRKTTIFNLLKAKSPDTLDAKDARGDTVAQAIAAHGYDALMSALIKEHHPILFSHNNVKKYPIHTALLNGQMGIVRLLLPVEGVTHLTDNKGRVALHYAATCQSPDIIQYCCQYYPNVDVRDDAYKTPLMCAAEVGNLPALKTLIEHGADVHLTDSFGLSLLHYAVNSRRLEMVSWLLQNTGVEINAKDPNGETPLSYAEQKGMDDITQLLLKSAITPGLNARK